MYPIKAQKLATKFIKQPGAITGNPKLVKQGNKKVYIVSVIYKSKNVGEIYIDAHSGKNLGELVELPNDFFNLKTN